MFYMLRMSEFLHNLYVDSGWVCALVCAWATLFAFIRILWFLCKINRITKILNRRHVWRSRILNILCLEYEFEHYTKVCICTTYSIYWMEYKNLNSFSLTLSPFFAYVSYVMLSWLNCHHRLFFSICYISLLLCVHACIHFYVNPTINVTMVKGYFIFATIFGLHTFNGKMFGNKITNQQKTNKTELHLRSWDPLNRFKRKAEKKEWVDGWYWRREMAVEPLK